MKTDYLKRSYIVLVLLCFYVCSVRAQAIGPLLLTATDQSAKNPQEKLYLHLDKNSYTAGEIIWIKAYSTVGVENLLSNVSGLAYIELIDPVGHIVDSLRIPLVMGLGVADIALHDTITEGSYRLRGYTNWMRNSDPEFFYDRTLSISNGRSDNVLTSTETRQGTAGTQYTVELSSMSGVPLRDIPVDFEILRDGKVIEHRRGRTDAAGSLGLLLEDRYRGSAVRYQFETSDKRRVSKFLQIGGSEAKHNVQLLPEGGRLLWDCTNSLGIKAVDGNGRGIVADLVFTSGTDTLARMQTNQLGMGAVQLFLISGQPVKAFATFADGSGQEVPFPEISASGHSLLLSSQQAGRLQAQFNISADRQDGRPLYFVVHHLGKVLLASQQLASEGQLSFVADISGLPCGVLTLTVLDADHLPIVERPFFNYLESSPLPIDIQIDKPTYQPRDKVTVSLHTDTSMIAALSATVVHLGKLDSVAMSTDANILSTLLLSSDIRGYIEAPGYYFTVDGIRRLDLDYLLLTQGWRKIDWQSPKDKNEPNYPAEKGIRISGHTKKFGRQAAEPHAMVQLFPSTNYMDFRETRSAEDGYFAFKDLLFPDSVGFVLSARDDKGSSRMDITVDEWQRPEIDYNRNAPAMRTDINRLQKAQIESARAHFAELEKAGLMKGAILIDEVLVERRKAKVSDRSRNKNGPGNADQIFTTADFKDCTTIFDCLINRITGLQWYIENEPPANLFFFLDGIHIDSLRAINIPPASIESVEVLRNETFTYAYSADLGVDILQMRPKPVILMITSKPGNEGINRSSIPKGRLTINPKGLHINKAFYKPSYDVSTDDNGYKDLRTTIHWEPSLVINKSGKASFDFYAADEPGLYSVILEGIDLHGNIVRKVKDIIIIDK